MLSVYPDPLCSFFCMFLPTPQKRSGSCRWQFVPYYFTSGDCWPPYCRAPHILLKELLELTRCLGLGTFRVELKTDGSLTAELVFITVEMKHHQKAQTSDIHALQDVGHRQPIGRRLAVESSLVFFVAVLMFFYSFNWDPLGQSPVAKTSFKWEDVSVDEQLWAYSDNSDEPRLFLNDILSIIPALMVSNVPVLRCQWTGTELMAKARRLHWLSSRFLPRCRWRTSDMEARLWRIQVNHWC